VRNLTTAGSTESERYLSHLCEKTFLKLWSHPNPYRDQGQSGSTTDGKELCDLLVVSGDDVIIFSDKYCEFKDSGRLGLDWERWYKRAIQRSAEQIFGAERWVLNFPDRVFLDKRCTRTLPLPLPARDRVKIKRVVVAHGAANKCREIMGGSGSFMLHSERSVPFTIGDFDRHRGFIHVLDDMTLDIVLSELDTIADFVRYLERKETLIRSGKTVVAAGEEDLLSYYINHMGIDGHDFVFPGEQNHVSFDEGLWQRLQGDPGYIRKKEADKSSYLWDEIIQFVADFALRGELLAGPDVPLTRIDQILRIMAREPRTSRRLLSQGLIEQMSAAPPGLISIRTHLSRDSNERAYISVFMPSRDETTRQCRRAYLSNYCFVAAWKLRQVKAIVGIATELGIERKTRSYDVGLVQISEWTPELEAQAEELQKKMDIFDKKLVHKAASVDEYPSKEDAYDPHYGMYRDRNASKTPSRKVGRNEACPCGSHIKYKRCCGVGQ
jgi:hypothetical protein